MSTDIEFLKELQTELKTQETDCQAAPRFWVIMDHKYLVTEKGYHDRVSVYDSGAAASYEIKNYCNELIEEGSIFVEGALAELEEFLKGPDYSMESNLIEWVEKYCKEVTVFYETEVGEIKENTMFLTKQEAKDHLKSNAHHYSKKARTYAMTAWRAPKVERLLRILETFDWNAITAMEAAEG